MVRVERGCWRVGSQISRVQKETLIHVLPPINLLQWGVNLTSFDRETPFVLLPYICCLTEKTQIRSPLLILLKISHLYLMKTESVFQFFHLLITWVLCLMVFQSWFWRQRRIVFGIWWRREEMEGERRSGTQQGIDTSQSGHQMGQLLMWVQ